jgi:ADP-ribose pyrophosphatase YjhB (NUDIX family)
MRFPERPRRLQLSLLKWTDRAVWPNDTACPPGTAADALTRAVALLEKRIERPTRGLPEPVFRLTSSLVPMVNVDLLVRNERGETLLTWREDGLCPPGWHVPGGIVRYKESLGARIRAVARQELGARVHFDEVPLSIAEIVASARRVRGHFISLLYACRLASPLPARRQARGGQPRVGQWRWHRGCPPDLLACQRSIYRKFLAMPEPRLRHG